VQSASRLTAAVVSSYALYFIGVARAPKSVVGLAAFQNGRLHASHAAPFDAEFRLQVGYKVTRLQGYKVTKLQPSDTEFRLQVC